MGLIENLLYPRKCVGCGREGKWICRECRGIIGLRVPICPKCCRYSTGGEVHEMCRRPWGMDGLVVPIAYKGVLQRGLKKVKYKQAWEFMNEAFEVWGERVNGEQMRRFDESWVVVPVPMNRRKEKERGFNQAAMMANKLGEYLGLKVEEKLVRVRNTRPQYGLNKKERGKNVRHAIRRRGEVKGGRFIVVDDVWTTGSTCRECAKALKRSKAREVWGVVLAR